MSLLSKVLGPHVVLGKHLRAVNITKYYKKKTSIGGKIKQRNFWAFTFHTGFAFCITIIIIIIIVIIIIIIITIIIIIIIIESYFILLWKLLSKSKDTSTGRQL